MSFNYTLQAFPFVDRHCCGWYPCPHQLFHADLKAEENVVVENRKFGVKIGTCHLSGLERSGKKGKTSTWCRNFILYDEMKDVETLYSGHQAKFLPKADLLSLKHQLSLSNESTVNYCLNAV